MTYPMSVMRGDNVKSLERLISHEDAKSSGMLVDFQFCTRTVSRMKQKDPSTRVKKTVMLALSGSRVLNPLRRIVYLGHRWQGPGLPDNSAGSKLRLIQRALNEDDFAWLDVWSLPCAFKSQDESKKVEAARSMPAYIFHASALLFVAPSREDFEQLLKSSWCQAELLAAM